MPGMMSTPGGQKLVRVYLPDNSLVKQVSGRTTPAFSVYIYIYVIHLHSLLPFLFCIYLTCIYFSCIFFSFLFHIYIYIYIAYFSCFSLMPFKSIDNPLLIYIICLVESPQMNLANPYVSVMVSGFGSVADMKDLVIKACTRGQQQAITLRLSFNSYQIWLIDGKIEVRHSCHSLHCFMHFSAKLLSKWHLPFLFDIIFIITASVEERGESLYHSGAVASALTGEAQQAPAETRKRGCKLKYTFV